MEDRSLQKISIDITLDRTYVNAAIEEGNYTDWQTVKNFFYFLGYDVKFVHVAISPTIPQLGNTNVIYFPIHEKSRLDTVRGRPHLSHRLVSSRGHHTMDGVMGVEAGLEGDCGLMVGIEIP